MARALEEFIAQFVMPMLGGGTVHIGKPVRPQDHALWSGAPELRDADLLFIRLRRAEALIPAPQLPDPDDEELALWMGLHNTLVFDHPYRQRVWARGATWQRVESATRAFLSLAPSPEVGVAVARHIAVAGVLQLTRRDTVVTTGTGEVRFEGVPAGQRVRNRGAIPASEREETVRWLEVSHQPEARRLLEDAFLSSPLTCLLRPLTAPPAWSPITAGSFLRHRGLARSVCHHWAAQRDWVGVGGAVVNALLAAVPGDVEAPRGPSPPLLAASTERRALPGVVDPAAVSAITAALIHLHFLKVLELDARIGAARDPGILSFLALPLLLPWLEPQMGSPVADVPAQAAFEAQIHRRWGSYIDHLQELVPRSVVDHLQSTLVPAILTA